ncbi:MAG: hypothetical protein JWR63_1566 [Conexibacter sp.]|jgi:hypothetical protein|nr:hypothetical protein [Conexibacter sp.]
MAPNVTEVQKALKGADYPADRDDLVALAERNGADEEVVDALRDADAESFDGPDQVMAALKGSVSGN